MCAIGEAHKWKQRPLILNSRVGLLVNTQPSLDLGASCMVELYDKFTLAGARRQAWWGNAHPLCTPEVQIATFRLEGFVSSEEECEG